MPKFDFVEGDTQKRTTRDGELCTIGRIRALTNIPEHNVKKGDLGGYIESEKNLGRFGESWVGYHGEVYGHTPEGEPSIVRNHALVDGTVRGGAIVGDEAHVDQGSIIEGNFDLGGHVKVKGLSWVNLSYDDKPYRVRGEFTLLASAIRDMQVHPILHTMLEGISDLHFH